MSVSTFESLPNEILIDIFEKYINGVDILIAFAYRQNQRFDAIISQCPRFYFNFLNCRKNHFSFCLGLLPAYVEKIEKLILSEENTPGQIHAFLTLFPSFIQFTRLRKLYFHFNAEAIEWLELQNALLSLSHTAIDTVLMKATNTDKMLTLNDVIGNIFRLGTIKRIVLLSDFQNNKWDFQHNEWNFLTDSSSNVEYLTISGISCEFQHLQSILRCAPRLKYLNIRLIRSFNRHHLTNPSNDNVISMPCLHTLILSFERHDPTKFDMLEKHLKAMPALRYLEITAHNALLQASDWEVLLQTSLPLLTHFSLNTTTSCVKASDMDNILASFETPFWIEKKDFYMIITKHRNSTKFDKDEMQIYDQDEFDQPVIQWWIVPFRCRLDDIPTNKIKSFGISGSVRSLSEYYYFQNVNDLVIYDLSQDLLNWLKTYVNYLRIKYLDVSHLNIESGIISSLLSTVRNITGLRIQYSCLLAHQGAYLNKHNCLKYLDVSSDQHSFDIQDINTISILFPNLEHISINATISNISLLKTSLPHLRSLTCAIISFRFPTLDDDGDELLHNHLRRNDEFLFRREHKWITYWIDHTALKQSCSQTFK